MNKNRNITEVFKKLRKATDRVDKFISKYVEKDLFFYNKTDGE